MFSSLAGCRLSWLFLDSERVKVAIPRDDEHFAGGNDRLAVVYPAWDNFLARVQLFARLRVEGIENEVGHRRRAKLGGGQRRRGGGCCVAKFRATPVTNLVLYAFDAQ